MRPNLVSAYHRRHEASHKVQNHDNELHEYGHQSQQNCTTCHGIENRGRRCECPNHAVQQAAGEEGRADGDGDEETSLAPRELSRFGQGEERDGYLGYVADDVEDDGGAAQRLSCRSVGGVAGVDICGADDAEYGCHHEGGAHQAENTRGEEAVGQALVSVRSL